MNKNVNILGTGIYHPNKKVTNDYYINHFKELGKDISAFLDTLGRNERYIIDNNSDENALTMALEAAKRALEAANISPEQLDAIVYSSDTPEYLCPSNALIINHYLNAVNAHTVYDLNSNCVGMVVALDQISRYMKTSKHIKYALVVGSVFSSSIARPDCKYTYPTSGDGAAAVVLECVDEPELIGIIDSKYCTKSEYYNTIISPKCGLSKMRSNEIPEYDKKQQWTPFPLDFFSVEWSKAIHEFSKEYDFSMNSIHNYFLSQYSKQFLIETAKILDIDDYKEKFTYIGDKYGYTGTTSPIFALHEALTTKEIEPGSKAVFCSVGAGVAMCTLLYSF
ncbi:ketoacyl-ACP synthase III [Clostridium neonatale]|uniref:3-oxoacyl-(Acyl-carrier-protein) synthase n=1 Tax=Clostridium neonatale TaxID=137838 RepID=A0AAD1YLN9_9CLOT|nr:ketoacyl-ACP synthase III [Clostridium neonatale]CAI3192007.1 putative 3-oxoacyl-(acyl-carrier-protein) synthase [Clostridium neonatale]CAI3204827.1 putative 3-oxoacyl-(acyl-carrier-protein) synthase [Clostridium neonatale]CAI3215500.1 putative 3-oxoacyl-(acyl-carrier-protein) synthase [Clostridium neonatale]CAI3239097.1 putative 3-oxoacyl-(acyl-carrier-protein) synthase [Clostridium neonatale]CAI3239458.1 putative 3-oxoacyl-(acyl-carrier-protein) synthase [Clostridium neonatale]